MEMGFLIAYLILFYWPFFFNSLLKTIKFIFYQASLVEFSLGKKISNQINYF